MSEFVARPQIVPLNLERSQKPTPEREFVGWPKIARLNRDIIITEKIDGTNAAIGITSEGDVYAQSRTRIITPESDNFGFAGWVEKNRDELLVVLGPGLHFGEWWGLGIQRGYGLTERRFSLFNTSRWKAAEGYLGPCYVVPTLYEGPFSEQAIWLAQNTLRNGGSAAAPGFMRPEGIVIFHTGYNGMFKVTLENEEPGQKGTGKHL